ncbi:ferrous iron transport protein A [Alcaligenes faecalis]|uniref:FeoA family protein n=1 Tax=Alcaligenes faecalis TaxID=511 RepID=UPI001293FF31|nr:FeoA family protein [Alcaligenes faecalis]MBX6964299.1 ferrous iron transport protein A [Providencia rettgeri]MBX7032385.1 ferrous iron transport protein A [Alcaligenes faecalis]QFY76721.1 ferrous iron transport protein A [Alcaligenes faecalis]
MRVQSHELNGQAIPAKTTGLPQTTLDTLARGQSGTVIGLQSTNNEHGQALILRLMEIGFLPGERVRVVATGFPGADPLAIRVGQATFALRRDEAAFVLIQPA